MTAGTWGVTGLAEVTETLLPLTNISDTLGGKFAAFVFFFGGLYLVYDGFGKWKTKRLIEDTPTEQVRSVAAGRTELAGAARAMDGALPAPFTDEECVYVEWEVESHNPDDDGSDWATVAKDTQVEPFYLDDGTGRIRIAADTGDPTVEISRENTTERIVGRGDSPPPQIEEFIQTHDSQYDENLTDDPIGAVTGEFKKIGHSDDRRRFTQKIIPEGSDVYVIGSAVEREGATMGGGQEDLLEVTRVEDFDKFLISDRSEQELEGHYEKRGPLHMIGGILISAFCLALLTGAI